VSPTLVNDPVVSWILSYGIGFLFLTSCFHKLRDFAAFEATVKNYELLPTAGSTAASALVIAAEAVVGLGTFAAAVRTTALAGALLLLAIYTVAIGINLARGRRAIDCGCMGPALRQSLSEWLLLRNGMLIAAAALALLPPTARELSVLDFSTIAFGTVSSILLYIAVNHLIANWPRLQQLRQ